MTSAETGDELVLLLDEDEPVAQSAGTARPSWKILVVDDDEEVHVATRFALEGVEILGRPLQLESAHSAAEAAAFLQENRDTAVVFLDVVMEETDSGLQLVEIIRGEMGLEDLRIILRTGQAGYAPELDVITQYDINDYRTKSELTHTRLITSLTSALRSYQQIYQINTSRAGLNQIIDATRDLLSREGLNHLAQGVLTQIGALLNLSSSQGLIVLSFPRVSTLPRIGSVADGTVIAATGRYAALGSKSILSRATFSRLGIIDEALEQRENVFTDQGIVLVCEGQQFALLVYLDVDRPTTPDERSLLSVFCQNIGVTSDNQMLIEELRTLAYFDELTHLPNRLSLTEAVQEALEAPRGKTLYLLDIDHFNSLHGSIGQEASERLLCGYAAVLQRRLLGRVRIIARICGDSFAVLADNRELDATDLRGILHTRLQLDDLNLNVVSTMASVPLDAFAFTAEQLISSAYATLKKAKAEGRGQLTCYHAGLIESIHDNAALLQALPQALEASRFEMHYQPKWDLRGRRCHGMEALIRWRTADGEWISPARFVPVAESSGMITLLGQWILRRACEEYARLRQRFEDPGALAVNISGAQFRDGQFVNVLKSCIQGFGIPPDQLVLEITETSAINSGLDEAIARLEGIRGLGVRIALDDFGTGFSSLSYLQMLPVDQLKIDRAFTRKVLIPKGRAVIRSIIEISHSLGLEVVAEGAEERDEVEALQALDCDYIQGYYYARPMPMAQLIQWHAEAARAEETRQ